MCTNEHHQCHEAADALLSGSSAKKASVEHIAHVVTCSECQNILSAIADLRTHKSAFEGESYPELKQKIMQKLTVTLAESKNSAEVKQKVIKLAPKKQNVFMGWLRYAFAFAVVILFFVYVISTGVISPKKVIKQTIHTAQNLTSKANFTIVINGSIENSITEDSTNLTLYKNETAEVTYSDGTACSIVGPAAVRLSKRGFDLKNGEIKVEVVEDSANNPFIAKTPHGEVKTFETAFKISVTPSITDVYVIDGKARLTNLKGKVKVLEKGQTGVMLPVRESKSI